MIEHGFFAGNVLISAMTNAGDDEGAKYEMQVDLEDWSGNRRFARYHSFRMGDEGDYFRLYHANSYYGNAGDSLLSHNGLPFTTFDKDNDNRNGSLATEANCARLHKVVQCSILDRFSVGSDQVYLYYDLHIF